MEKEVEEIESCSLRFPSQFSDLDDVFQFSYDAMVDVAGKFEPEVDISALLEDLQTYFMSDESEEDSAEDILHLIRDELEIAAFSKSSRCSIIQL